MCKEIDPCTLQKLEEGTYFENTTKEPLTELIYFNDGAIILEGIFDPPEKLKFDLDYCNTTNC
jgi:hypothetical protein